MTKLWKVRVCTFECAGGCLCGREASVVCTVLRRDPAAGPEVPFEERRWYACDDQEHHEGALVVLPIGEWFERLESAVFGFVTEREGA